MDSKYKDDLFRKYVQFHECKLSASDNKQRPINDEYLRVAAAAFLCLPKIDPFYRFRLIKFYEMAENSLRSVKSSSLHSLHNAFSMLETVGINLFLYPWKKEFKNIKTYTGPFVYYVKSALTEDDVRQILNYMGYVQELGTMYKLKEQVDAIQVKMVSFELFLAKVECEQLVEIHLQVKDKGYSEVDVINERKNSTEDIRGCSEAMKRRVECKENLNTSMARMVLQKSASERASKDYFKPKATTSLSGVLCKNCRILVLSARFSFVVMEIQSLKSQGGSFIVSRYLPCQTESHVSVSVCTPWNLVLVKSTSSAAGDVQISPTSQWAEGWLVGLFFLMH
ncbi:spermatogenesis-associated protein 2 isoform X2 [Strigops habroptila]|uniref:spermatogenesis-associated protein 2 isoform X2 n=1 Tax=Strigops habroptila TaxID=2489341 RepID=UPI0011CF3774|nr:spermatogenesis-associated protein 2 isoform X2 [Strigops habroptila]